MSNDEARIEDVHRWYYGGTAPEGYEDDASGDDAIGYEAAHPVLQSLHWPEASWTASAVLVAP